MCSATPRMRFVATPIVVSHGCQRSTKHQGARRVAIANDSEQSRSHGQRRQAGLERSYADGHEPVSASIHECRQMRVPIESSEAPASRHERGHEGLDRGGGGERLAVRAREVRTRRRRDTCGRRRAGVLTRWPRRVASRRVRRTRAFQKRGHALLRVVRERQPQYSDGLPRTRSSGNQRLDEFLGRRGARQRRGSQGVRHRAAAGSRNKGLEGSSKMRAERFEVPTFGPQPRRRRWSGFRTDLR
jgi:hypothetical protein